jgi:hypothetical protein
MAHNKLKWPILVRRRALSIGSSTTEPTFSSSEDSTAPYSPCLATLGRGMGNVGRSCKTSAQLGTNLAWRTIPSSNVRYSLEAVGKIGGLAVILGNGSTIRYPHLEVQLKNKVIGE